MLFDFSIQMPHSYWHFLEAGIDCLQVLFQCVIAGDVTY